MTIITNAAAVISAVLCSTCATVGGGEAPKIVRVPLITAVLAGGPQISRVEVKKLPWLPDSAQAVIRIPVPS